MVKGCGGLYFFLDDEKKTLLQPERAGRWLKFVEQWNQTGRLWCLGVQAASSFLFSYIEILDNFPNIFSAFFMGSLQKRTTFSRWRILTFAPESRWTDLPCYIFGFCPQQTPCFCIPQAQPSSPSNKKSTNKRIALILWKRPLWSPIPKCHRRYRPCARESAPYLLQFTWTFFDSSKYRPPTFI